MKATQGVKLDTALKDCTKAIELGDSPAAALDSRALVYFKLGRLDDARADLDAALDLHPNLAASLYLRGVVRRRQGAAATGDADLDGARFFAPRIDEDYAGYGVKPS
ncbi:tetratricopeptide repeat protein [Sphingomonas sp.]|uniref:tetratricopeptide repeat protein n=1 Tax=Sphingomonas sp. TaxID=28214 RepID=UPI003CC6CBEE